MSHRNTEVLSFSLLPQEARRIKKAAKATHKGLSDFLRDAAKRAAIAYEWRGFCQKGERSARQLRISPEEIEDLIDELRT